MNERQKELSRSFLPDTAAMQKNTTLKPSIYMRNTRKIKTTKEIENRINQANQDIKMLEKYIDMLKVYNISLVERYDFLCCCNYSKIYRLKREKRYSDGKIFYFLYEIQKNDETGQEEILNTTKYSGTERTKALKDFEELKKINKSAIFELSIKTR